ncbi:MAG: flagellar hook-associated protein FlgL [Pseudomonadota bacterium]
MRISTNSLYNNIIGYLDSLTERMNSANEVVATGKQINKPSDDPVGLNSVLGLRSSLANLKQLSRNIDTGKTWLDGAESALQGVSDVVVNTKLLAISMATATISADERKNMAATVENLQEQLAAFANTTVSGRYIFAGSKSDVSPFEVDGTYSGDNTAFSVKISKNTNVEVGRDGEAVFGVKDSSDDIFKTLSDLKTALEGNDVTGIQDQMTRLDDHLNCITTLIADTGQKSARFDAQGNIMADLDLSFTERKSTLEDADMIQAVMDLKQIENSYSAALASGMSIINSKNIMDYF